MIEVKSFVFNPFMENTYVLYDESKEGVVIDPGCVEDFEENDLSTFIEKEDLKIVKLLNTHGHIDHILGNTFIKDKYGVSLYMHQLEMPVYKSVESYAPSYGFSGYREAEIDETIEEGDIIQFGNSELEVIFVPGHSPGHVAFINKEEKICIGGDVLFKGSIGRTDLPGGDYDTLIESIHEKIFPLDESTIVYSGHGPPTTIKEEKFSNPFCGLHKIS